MTTAQPSAATGGGFSTGELRAALQPVVFLRLTTDHAPGFEASRIVAAQYWGNGQVRLTRYRDAAALTLVAHRVHGDWLTSPHRPGPACAAGDDTPDSTERTEHAEGGMTPRGVGPEPRTGPPQQPAGAS